MAIFHGNAIPSAVSAYSIDYSCRFDSASSAKLSRTPGSAGNRRTYTISFWFKRASLETAGPTSGAAHMIMFDADANHDLYISTSTQYLGSQGNGSGYQQYDRVFRDTSAWYHYVLAVDTTQGAAANRVKQYLNGELLLAADYTGSDTNLNSDSDVNNTVAHTIGGKTSGNFFDGLIAEFHLIDGTQLDADDFGESGDYGEWKPIEVSGLTYGTNGCYLDFSGASTKHIITASGSAQHSTTEQKIGATSIDVLTAGELISAPIHSDFNWVGDFTVECWFWKASSWGSYTRFFNSGAGVAGDEHINLDFNGTTLRAHASTSGSARDILSQTTTSHGISSSTWHHVAYVRNGSNFNVYIDGVSKLSGTSSSTIATGGGITFGGYDKYVEEPTTLAGYLDEMRVSSVARYTSGFTPSTSAFTSDANTLLLIHSDTTNGSTTFADSSGITGGFGNDSSGEDNHFTITNLTASDQMTDTPTNNFCTWDGVNSPVGTLSEGNLKVVGTSHDKLAVGTFPMSSGKWYWEVQVVTNGARNFLGVAKLEATPHGSYASAADDYAGVYGHDGATYQRGGTENAEFGSSFSSGDIITICFDADIGSFWLNKNAAPDTSATALVTSLPSGLYNLIYEEASGSSRATNILNAGQDGTFAGTKTAQGNADGNGYGNFYYAPPSSHLALCSQNLPDCAVTPSEHFNTVLWTGDSSSDRTISGVGFQPDLVWIKGRTIAASHVVADAVRGGTKHLQADGNGGEMTDSWAPTFASDGFIIGNNAHVNTGYNYVAWNWKANGSGSSNTEGSINTTATSANVDAGFSCQTWTGDGATSATIGHGLSKAPELVIVKNLAGGGFNWMVGCKFGTMDWTDYLTLNSSITFYDNIGIWNDEEPDADDFTIGTHNNMNQLGESYVGYCWHSVEGYSKIGSYKGNGNADGTFVYCGFRPAYIILKRIGSAGSWHIQDSARSTYNVVKEDLEADGAGAESDSTARYTDFLSNGFKHRNNSAERNGVDDYLYMAFAETPFKNANAR